DLDRHPRRMGDISTSRERRRVRLVLLEDLDDRALQPGTLEQRRRVRKVVSPEHDVDVAGAFDDEVAVLLGQAATHGDLHFGTSLLEGFDAAQVAVQLVVGVLADAARVEDDDVGFVDVVGVLHALGREKARDALRVVLVHLTSERADVEAARLGLRQVSVGGKRPLRSSAAGRGGDAIHLSGLEYAIALAAVTIGAVVQGSVGFGANIVAVPVIAVLEPGALPATLALVVIPLVIVMAVR